MAFLDAFVVNVALPTIDEELGLGLTGEQWIFLSYSLALAALYLPAGALGDRYGYANTFVIGVAGFAAASVLAGVAPTSEVLIGARAIQGVFGALLTPGSLALLRATYGDEAGKAIGAWTAWTSVATVAGPVVGGAIVETVSWRVIFLLNIPLAIVTVVLTLVSRDTCRTQLRHRQLDVYGAVLGAIAVGALVWALVEGPEVGFGSPTVVGGFVLAGVAFAAFIWVESRVAEPMMPLSLFRIRELSVANLATFFVYAALGSAIFFVVLFGQSVLGYSPTEAGLMVAPISIVIWLLAGRFGRASDRLGPRLFLVVGPVLIGVGLALLGRLDAGASYWSEVFPGLLVFSDRAGRHGAGHHLHCAEAGSGGPDRRRLGHQHDGLPSRTTGGRRGARRGRLAHLHGRRQPVRAGRPNCRRAGGGRRRVPGCDVGRRRARLRRRARQRPGAAPASSKRSDWAR